MNTNLDRVCYFCQKMFLFPCDLLQHMATHTKETPNFCKICSKGFKSKRNLRRHSRSHLSLNFREDIRSKSKQVCKLCGKKLLNKSHLNQHILTHTKEIAYQCDICKQRFSTKGSLLRHKQLVHDKLRPFPCKECGKQFGTKQELKIHSIVHSGARDLRCDKCLKAFDSNSTLNRHIRNVHLGQKRKAQQIECWKLKCYFCKKKFLNTPNLEDHMRTHTKETPFFCNDCKRGFSSKAALRYHKKTHLSQEEKNKWKLGFKYPCKICQKRYQTQSYLLVHILSHTKEKPFSCKICKTGFSARSSLNVHEKSAH